MRVGRGRLFSRTMSERSVRFLRDVTASILATGIASIAFSHLSREPAPRPNVIVAGKLDDRLSWKVEEIPTRDTRIYDTLDMFALPLAAERGWSETAASAVAAGPERLADGALAKPAKARAGVSVAQAVAEMPRRMALDRLGPALVPPSRPAEFVAALPIALVSAAEPAAQPIRILGWNVPGSDLIPSGHDALGKIASLGGKVAAMGDAIVETVGLK